MDVICYLFYHSAVRDGPDTISEPQQICPIAIVLQLEPFILDRRRAVFSTLLLSHLPQLPVVVPCDVNEVNGEIAEIYRDNEVGFAPPYRQRACAEFGSSDRTVHSPAAARSSVVVASLADLEHSNIEEDSILRRHGSTR